MLVLTLHRNVTKALNLYAPTETNIAGALVDLRATSTSDAYLRHGVLVTLYELLSLLIQTRAIDGVYEQLPATLEFKRL